MTTERMNQWTSHGAGGSDDGFSLIEAVVASFIMVVLFAGFGRSLGTAYLGSKDNAATQEATAIGVERLEFARSLAWSHIGMPSVADDSPLVDPSQQVVAAEPAGLDADESLVVDPDGLIDPVETESVDGVTYTVWSTVSSAPQGLRRLIVLVQWEVEGATASHRTSTLIAEAATR